MDGQKTRGNGGVGIQQSTINNKIDGVWHGGSNGGSLEKNRSNGMDGRPGASGAQTTMTIWQSRRRQSIALIQFGFDQAKEEKSKNRLGVGNFVEDDGVVFHWRWRCRRAAA